MTQRIEFANAPPTVNQMPKNALRLIAKSLVETARKNKLQTKEKKGSEEKTHKRGT